MNETLEVIPREAELSQPLFRSKREYEEFRASYAEQIEPELEVLREARRQSEEASKQHCVTGEGLKPQRTHNGDFQV